MKDVFRKTPVEGEWDWIYQFHRDTRTPTHKRAQMCAKLR